MTINPVSKVKVCRQLTLRHGNDVYPKYAPALIAFLDGHYAYPLSLCPFLRY